MNGAHGWPFDRPGGNGGTRMILNPLTLWLDPVAGRVIEGAVAMVEGFTPVTAEREAMQSLSSGCTDGSRATNCPPRQ
jgi:hypothetical protein